MYTRNQSNDNSLNHSMTQQAYTQKPHAMAQVPKVNINLLSNATMPQ